MKRFICLISFLFTAACSSPTGPGQQPSWADNTSWKGSVTMTPGTTLNVMFRLTTALGPASDWSPQNVWHIAVVDPRIENVATGKIIGTAGAYTFADDDLKSVHVGMIADSAFDPLLPNCATPAQPGNQPYYNVDLHLAGDGTLTGTVALSCFAPGTPIATPQPIVVLKI